MSWLLTAANETLTSIGSPQDLTDYVLDQYSEFLETCKQEDDSSMFDFYKLLFSKDDYKSTTDWYTDLSWSRAIPLQWLKRNWFDDELYWKENPHCSGFEVDHNSECDLRPKEIQLN